MKKLLIILTMTLMRIMAFADDVTNLVIRQKAGNETILSLDSNPVITFEEDYMNLSNDFVCFSFPIADIDLYLVSNTTDVKNIHTQPLFSHGQVIINELPKGTKVYVYSMDGKVLCDTETNDSGSVNITLRDLPKGTFVISASDTIIKIANK